MSVTIKTLEDSGSNSSNLLYCSCCGSEYSANPSDYSFWMRADVVFTCQNEECGGVELELVRKVTSFIPV